MVGVLDRVASTNVSQAKVFFDKGYTVIPINYRTLITNYGYEFFETLLLKVVLENQPKLVMFCKCNGINPETVKKCSDLATTMLWNPDLISEDFIRCPEVVEHAKFTNFSSCTNPATLEYFKKAGVKNCYHIFEGADAEMFKRTNSDPKYEADISFIGSSTPQRDGYRDILLDAGYNVKFYGGGYPKEVVNKEFATVCSSSRYMLSVDTVPIADSFSDRIFRYMSCGACVLHLDMNGTTDKYFKDGEEVIIFKSPEELLKKLKVKHAPRKIGNAARKCVLNNYTYKHTIDKILELTEKHSK